MCALSLLAIPACQKSTKTIGVRVEPEAVELSPLTTQPFTANVGGTVDTRIGWSIQRGVGTIDAVTGVYTAPDRVPRDADNDIVIRATSLVDTSRYAEATVHIVPVPFSPTRGPTEGGTRLTVSGSDFVGGTTVLFDGTPGTDVAVESSVLLRVTTPPRALIGAAEVVVQVPGKPALTYPRGFHYAATQLRLGTGQLINTCQYAQAVVPFDVDRDGKSDLLAACYYDSKIAIYRNEGSALNVPTFLPTAALYPRQLVLADHDGDGDDDLYVVGNYEIQIFTHEADGSFLPATDYMYPPGVYGYSVDVIAKDLNGDDLADLAYTRAYDDLVNVVRQNPAGGFFPALALSVGQNYPYDIDAGYLDADGDLDLVVTYETTVTPLPTAIGGVVVYLNNGAATGFTATTLASGRNYVTAVALGDFDGDTNEDIVYTTRMYDGFDLSVRRGLGNGTFLAAQTIADDDVPFDIRSLRVADADADGIVDVFTDGYYYNATRVFYGNGSMLVGPPARFDMTSYSSAVPTLFDFDGMGPLDIANLGYESLEVQAGQPNRVYGAPRVDIGNNPEYLDIRLNSTLATQNDLVVALRSGSATGFGAISVVRSGEILSDTLVSQKFDLPANSEASKVRVGDLDKDGVMDALVTDTGISYNANLGSVWILPGLPEGGFGSPIQELFDTSVTDVRAADLDGDGLTDLVVAVNDPVTDLGELRILWGDGPLSFGNSTQVAGGGLPYRFDLADLDDDGRMEIVASDNVAGRIAIIRVSSSRGVAEPIFLAVGDSPTEIIVDDVNEDYIPDLIVLARYSAASLVEVDVVRGLGTLQFDLPERYRIEGNAYSMIYDDIDGDEKKDITLSMSYPSAVAVFRGHDGGRFREPEYAPVGGSPLGLSAIDFDGDGLKDIVVSDPSGAALRPLANKSK